MANTKPSSTSKKSKKTSKSKKSVKKEVTSSASVQETSTPTTSTTTTPTTSTTSKSVTKHSSPKTTKSTSTKSSTSETSSVELDHMTSTLQGLTNEFNNVLTRLNELSSMVTSVKNEVRRLEKHATRELKTSLKLNSKRKRKSGNRSPSGFVKPTLISNELAKFLGKEEGSEMARTEVTKELNCYIRANNLQDKQNGRKINADKKLSALLKLNKNDELTYFNLQKYMSPHFAKANSNKNVVVSTSSV